MIERARAYISSNIKYARHGKYHSYLSSIFNHRHAVNVSFHREIHRLRANSINVDFPLFL